MGYSLLLLSNPLPMRTAADSLAMGWGGHSYRSMRCHWNNKDVLWHAAFSSFSSFFSVWVHCSHRGKKDSSNAVASVDGGEHWGLCPVHEVDEVKIRVVSFCFDESRAIWSGRCMIVTVTCIILCR
jgi:hypothetical protein